MILAMEDFSLAMNQQECEELRQLLQNQEQTPIEIHHGIRELWFHNEDWSSELRLLFLGKVHVLVSRVAFINRRQGTMTKVLGFLEKFCKEHEVSRIVIQSVETPEMAAFCEKNHFAPSPTASMLFDGVILGDYIKEIA